MKSSSDQCGQSSKRRNPTASAKGSERVQLRLRRRSPSPRHPANHNAIRDHTDVEIEERLLKLFLHAFVVQLSVSVITPDKYPVRPYNDFKVKRIAVEMKRGFLGHETVGVWKTDEIYALIFGNQKYLGHEFAGGRVAHCFVIDDLPHHTDEDLEYASLIARRYSPLPAPRSFISHIIKVRTIMKWLMNRDVLIGSIDVQDIIKYFPKPPPEDEQSDRPVLRHWSHGKSSFEKVSKILHMAKVFMQGNMEGLLDDIKRTCFDPVKQVSRNALLEAKKLEQLSQGAGTKVLERYLEDLNKTSKSKDPHKNKKIKLVLSAREQAQFNLLKESQADAASEAGAGGSSRSSKRQAMKKVEKRISLIHEGITDVKDSSGEHQNALRNVEKTVERLEALISALK